MTAEPTPDQRFDAFFEASFDRAHRVATRLVGDPVEAQDLAGEAFARAYARWGRVRRHPAPEAWVLRTTTNLAIDRLRRGPAPVVAVSAADPSDVAALRVTLAAALERLSKRQRTVVVLRYLADLPEQEVAELLAISPGAVKTHLHRGLAHLRDVLDVPPEEPDHVVPAV